MSKGTSQRWMEGGFENEIRITVRCLANEEHAKVLRFDAAIGFETANLIAGILDGTSRHYITKPGPRSPLGKCATCGGQLETSLEERHNAQHRGQIEKHRGKPHQSHA